MTWCFKHLADSSWRTFQRHNLHTHSVCLFTLSFVCDVLNHPAICQCSNVANLFRCLERSMLLIFPSSLEMAIIQTSLEQMPLVCFFRPFVFVGDLLYGVTIQSILPILVIPPLHTTLTVSFPLWIGNHGVRQLTIRC